MVIRRIGWLEIHPYKGRKPCHVHSREIFGMNSCYWGLQIATTIYSHHHKSQDTEVYRFTLDIGKDGTVGVLKSHFETVT